MPSNFSAGYQQILASNIATMLFYTENGGNAATVNQFTYNGVGQSTYAYGLMQFDVGNSAPTRAFLSSNPGIMIALG